MNIIVACDKNYGIGVENKLPWKLKEDMLRFKSLTVGIGGNVVIMGRNTHSSLKMKALPRRKNVVVSKSLFLSNGGAMGAGIKYIENDGFTIFYDLKEAFDYSESFTAISGDIWIIGGSVLYDDAIDKLPLKSLHVTTIHDSYDCDVYLGSKTIDLINHTKWDYRETYPQENCTFSSYFNKNLCKNNDDKQNLTL